MDIDAIKQMPKLFYHWSGAHPEVNCHIDPGMKFAIYLEKLFVETQYLFMFTLKRDQGVFLYAIYESYACDHIHEFDHPQFGVAGFSEQEAIEFLIGKIFEKIHQEKVLNEHLETLKKNLRQSLVSAESGRWDWEG